MKRKLAKLLHECALRLDPPIKSTAPSLMVQVACDTTQLRAGLADATRRIQEFMALAEQASLLGFQSQANLKD